MYISRLGLLLISSLGAHDPQHFSKSRVNSALRSNEGARRMRLDMSAKRGQVWPALGAQPAMRNIAGRYGALDLGGGSFGRDRVVVNAVLLIQKHGKHARECILVEKSGSTSHPLEG